ncbi:high osmolarity signaling protein sho1 [Aulographum hederae CBS 113979]|uniref:High osmolarity signaling protein sho1 n=1 Tax=Aulographum hederae CBS 113979 TaxID=1176131 RepID=A0A6G1H769_9PEZI|nr:high osmolarity signaling protein sho1 [Aulographum hederae CBS 113979]
MPPYGSLQSPSLRKMEGNGRFSGGTKFSLGYIIGDPFALATVSIAILAWLIALVSSIIADIQENFPNYAWWALVYMFFVICGVVTTLGTDSEYNYHVATTAFLAAGLVFNTSAVNNLVYSPNGAKEASAAGFILLSMISVVWILYYGTQPNASPRAYVDSFAMHKGDKNSFQGSRNMSNAYNVRPETTVTAAPSQPQMYTSAQLNGFETSSPVSGYHGGPVGGVGGPNNNGSDAPRFGAAPQMPNSSMQNVTSAPNGEPEVSAPTEYPYRAKAIYSYEANPDDQNEISFSKHEILEVSDVSGRWWQAKKENGETGIAPSNYLILL